MKALVIGATGFIGYHVTKRLCEEGHAVRCLLRPSSDRRRLAGHPVEIRLGDLADARSIRDAVDGCDWVFHAGGRISLWSGDLGRLERDHVQGTRNVLAACEGGRSRLVYTGSVSTLGRPGPDGTIGDEDTPFDWNERIHAYGYAKLRAEREVRKAAASGVDAVVVMPTTTFGPNDFNLSAARMIADVDSGKIFGYPSGGMTVSHWSSVAQGHVLAAMAGRRGERYVLGGDHFTYRELFSLIASEIGRRAPLFPVPGPLLRVLGAGGSLACSVLRRDLGFTRTTALLGRLKLYYSSERAIREIGYRPRPAAEAVRDACRWYRGEAGAKAAA